MESVCRCAYCGHCRAAHRPECRDKDGRCDRNCRQFI